MPQWLKDGYTALVEDVDSSTLEELLSLGADTAIRILYTQNQTHIMRIGKAAGSEVYCGYCLQHFKCRQVVRYEETGPYARTNRCSNPSCKHDPGSSGYGAYTQLVDIPVPITMPSRPSNIAEKVAEVFEAEIVEAERRNEIPSA